MLRNYLVTAIRNLWRSRLSTLINLSGLTLGAAASLILFLVVRHHNSFDKFNSKYDRIYRVVASSDGNQGKDYTPGVPPVLPDAFRLDFPDAEEVTFTSYRGVGGLITLQQPQGEPKKFSFDNGVVYTLPNFFSIFDRAVLKGDVKTLSEPNTVAISQEIALKFFGKEDALGEVLTFEKNDFKVSAIVENKRSNTDMPFDAFFSYITIKKEREQGGWGGIWSDEQCYFLLKKESSIAQAEKNIPVFVAKHLGKDNYSHQTFSFQPLSDLHFNSNYDNYNYNMVSSQLLLALTVIGIFLIVTACINFINLVTAEAIKRSKEVGIRKTLGSSRSQLMFQFIGESFLVTLISVLLGIGFAQMGLNFLNPFLKLKLQMNFLQDQSLWVFITTCIVLVTFLSGVYPALVVSGFKPVFAIKNLAGNKNSSGYRLRQGLVVMQFFISQFFIISTIVLIQQMNYFKNKDLGFNREAVVTIPIPENSGRNYSIDNSLKMRTLRDEVKRIAFVQDASLSNNAPSSGHVSSTNIKMEGKEYQTQLKFVDDNYLKLYGIQLLAGKNVLDLDTAQGLIVNQKLMRMMGLQNPEDIIGKLIKPGGRQILPVIGVVKDFNTVSLHDPIEATLLLNHLKRYQTLSVKVSLKDFQSSIKTIQQKWEATYPEFIFTYRFLDDEIKEFYESEERMGTILSGFTSIAIFIGCLGLFGLATFMANQKTKEVGVRKVLGASVESIVLLFSREYIKLILIGFALAAPLAWTVMNNWLSSFTYRIDIGFAIFATALGITFAIALLTVGYRSIKAAIANPVDSLRSE